MFCCRVILSCFDCFDVNAIYQNGDTDDFVKEVQ